jgi:holo-[acyl-carrier protein] synthase
MPTYDYKCTACKHTFEHFQSMKDAVLRTCPQCKKKSLERLIGTGAALIFKGAGFYQTDYRSENYKAREKADAPPTGEASARARLVLRVKRRRTPAASRKHNQARNKQQAAAEAAMAKPSKRERPSLTAPRAFQKPPAPRKLAAKQRAQPKRAQSAKQSKPASQTATKSSRAPMLALGIDITEVARIEQMVVEHGQRFLTRVFTQRELTDAGEGKGKFMHLAARFAAKEAAMKALGTGLASGITWRDVETQRTPSGAPQLVLRGRAQAIAQHRAIESWVISLTHTKTTAVAVVIGSAAVL